MNSDRLREAVGGVWDDVWPFYENAVPESRSWHLDFRLPDAGEELVNRWLYSNPNRPGIVPPNRNALWGGGRFGSHE